MAFSFGSASQPAFGSTAPKPTGFGTPFGVTTTTASTGFGGFGASSFGAAQPAPTAFGAAAQPVPTGFGGAQQASTAFGATQQASTAFGATQQAPTAFGATQQPSAFGATQQPSAGFGSTFGAQPSSAPAFGSTFGAPASSTPAFGAAFGTPASTAAPSFGTSFGTPGASLFGTPTSKPSLFGTPTTATSLFATPASSTPSLFGTTTTPQAQPSLFGSIATSTPSLFGGGGTTATPSLFGTATTTTPSLFGSTFGQTATTAAPSLFGAAPSTGSSGFNLFGGTTTTNTPSLFGGFGTGQTTTGAFGTTQPTLGGFGTTQPTTGAFGTGTTAFGGFGGTTGTFGTTQQTVSNLFGGSFGVKPAQPAGIAPLNHLTAQQQQNQQVLASIYAINIFNDERDDILKKWNLLQACWGTGKGYYNPNQPPVEYTVQNPFYRFKAVGYNVIPEHENAEGIVKLIFNKKFSEINPQKQVLINGIGGILGNKPNLKVTIQHIKSLSDVQTEVRIIVAEKGVTGNTRKIPATDLANYLNQPTQKQQLSNVGIVNIIPYVTPSKGALEEYLRTVPQGFDPQMWKASIIDNPNPSKYMPVPIFGFNDLKARKLKQEYETGIHRAFEEKLTNELEELKKKHANSTAKINELKQRFLHLQHRTLKIIVRQESIRKSVIAIQPEEEVLKGKLETLAAHLNTPTQFKGKLNELISTIKITQKTMPAQPQYKLLADSQTELKEFLQLQQSGIGKLVDIVKDDLRCISIITDGMRDIMKR